MPHRRTARLGRAFLTSLLLGHAAFALDPDIEFVLQDAGEVRLAPQTLPSADYVVAVYAERLQDLPAPAGAMPKAPGPLPTGCLPVVRIQTASGRAFLPKMAELSFGCSDLPEGAQIHAWTGQSWQPIPTDRLPDGRAVARFTQTAIYGLFLQTDVPRI